MPIEYNMIYPKKKTNCVEIEKNPSLLCNQ